jgi:hypothetical protein
MNSNCTCTAVADASVAAKNVQRATHPWSGWVGAMARSQGVALSAAQQERAACVLERLAAQAGFGGAWSGV